MFLTYAQYLAYVADAAKAESAEQFIGEYGCPPECPLTGDGVVAMCSIIFAASRNDWRALTEASGMKGTQMCAMFELPYRSWQSWIDNGSGHRDAPSYLIRLVGYALITGLVNFQNQYIYLLIDQIADGDCYDSVLDAINAEDALAEAQREWDRMSDRDRSQRSEFYIGKIRRGDYNLVSSGVTDRWYGDYMTDVVIIK